MTVVTTEPSVDRPDEPGRRRAYSSPKRERAARETRRAIRDAAERLFLRDGYARTSMKAIAAEAGVSERTVYLAFATKATLLRDVIRVAVRGDEAPATLAERPEWRAVLVGPGAEVFARFAALNAKLMARTAPIIAVGESAADADPEIADHRDRGHAGSRADLLALGAVLLERGLLAPGISAQRAADVLYAVAADESVYLRLTRGCGWSDDQYAELIARTLAANLAPA